MRKVQRSEILDYQTYGDRREAVRQAVMELKRPRRIHVGAYLTFQRGVRLITGKDVERTEKNLSAPS